MNEILSKANIPEDQWQYCYIDENNRIFTPIYNENDEILYDGKEHYNIWLKKKDEPSEIPQSEEEILQAQLLLNQMDIINRQNEQDEVLAQLLLNSLEV